MSSHASSRRPANLAGAVLALGGVAVLAAGLWSNARFFHDDAYISLRYATNLASGHGLTWNPGETPVEGYTNFLFTVLCALLIRLGVAPVPAAHTVNVLGVAILGIGVSAIARQLAGAARPGTGAIIAGGTAALSIASYPLAIWILGGLEAPLFAALSACGVGALALSTDRDARRWLIPTASALLGLATLTRVDGALLAAGGLAAVAWRSGWRWRPAVLYATPMALLMVPHLVWRWLTYGALLPNTWYAKVSGLSGVGREAGLTYLWAWLHTPPWPLALAAVAAGGLALRRLWTRRATILAGAAALNVATVVLVGGDHMPGFRFFVPTGALCALIVAEAWPVWAPNRPTAAATCAALLALASLQSQTDAVTGLEKDPAAFVGEIVGRHIATAWPPGSVVALHTAGSTPFYAPDNTYIDMLGLNDAQIARREVTRLRTPGQRLPGHAKGDGKYVLDRAPDYIILGPAEGTPASRPWFLSDVELAELPGFERRYRLVEVVLDIRAFPGIHRHARTRDGTLVFTYYARRPSQPVVQE